MCYVCFVGYNKNVCFVCCSHDEKELRNHNQHRDKKADKTNFFAVRKKTDYHSKLRNILNVYNKFQKSNNNSTKQQNQKLIN